MHDCNSAKILAELRLLNITLIIRRAKIRIVSSLKIKQFKSRLINLKTATTSF